MSNSIKEGLKAIWVFIRDEIPEALKKYKVLQIIMTGYLSYLLHFFALYVTAAPYSELQDWQVTPVVGAIGGLITGLLAVLKQISTEHPEGR